MAKPAEGESVTAVLQAYGVAIEANSGVLVHTHLTKRPKYPNSVFFVVASLSNAKV